MGFEKESKPTGFFNLFEWKTKPRKKLFANQYNHSEDVNPNEANFSIYGGDSAKQMRTEDFSYCSSLADEDMYTSKSPGVVGRLMGLNSLPISSDASNTPYFEEPQKKNYINGSQEQQVNFRSPARPIEKFQSEFLPPKSARSIPTTHHKLLSPVKCSRFSNSKAYIIEAAAKIIESNPQSLPKAKAPKVGSSSAPLKVANLREKVEGSQVTSRRISSKIGESLLKRNSKEVESIKGAEKSISLAIQAKVNVQKRGIINQRELSSKQTGKNIEKKCANGNSHGVLKPNGLKQNGASDKNKLSPKSSASNTKKQASSNSKQISSRKVEANKNESTTKRSKEPASQEKGTKKTQRKKRMIADQTQSNTYSPSHSISSNVTEETKREENSAVPFPTLSLRGSISEPAESKIGEKSDVSLTHISQTSNETQTLGRSFMSKPTTRSSITTGACESNELMDCASSKPKKENTSWELDYISKILSNISKKCEDHAMGRTSKVISPHLYEQIETRKYWRDSDGRTERKSVFDFVDERVEKSCDFIGCKVLDGEKLVRQVYKEVMTWKSMWHCMVDEVVEKDMSFLEGRWLDFESDNLSLRNEIECHVLDSLMEELFQETC